MGPSGSGSGRVVIRRLGGGPSSTRCCYAAWGRVYARKFSHAVKRVPSLSSTPRLLLLLLPVPVPVPFLHGRPLPKIPNPIRPPNPNPPHSALPQPATRASFAAKHTPSSAPATPRDPDGEDGGDGAQDAAARLPLPPHRRGARHPLPQGQDHRPDQLRGRGHPRDRRLQVRAVGPPRYFLTFLSAHRPSPSLDRPTLLSIFFLRSSDFRRRWSYTVISAAISEFLGCSVLRVTSAFFLPGFASGLRPILGGFLSDVAGFFLCFFDLHSLDAIRAIFSQSVPILAILPSPCSRSRRQLPHEPSCCGSLTPLC